MGNEGSVSSGEEVCLKGTNVLEVCGEPRSTLRVHLVDKNRRTKQRGCKKEMMRLISQNEGFFFFLFLSIHVVVSLWEKTSKVSKGKLCRK